MLCTVYIPGGFPFPLSFSLLPEFPDFVVLLALKAVEQYTADTFVKILFTASNHFLQEVRFGGSETTFVFLLFEIRSQNLVHRVFRRKRYERHILGDILPVVDEKGFEMIRYMYTHRGTQIEIFFLEIIWSVSKLDCPIRSFR